MICTYKHQNSHSIFLHRRNMFVSQEVFLIEPVEFCTGDCVLCLCYLYFVEVFFGLGVICPLA